ncbi:MAG: two-component system response regulator, partial [Bacteroidia bacterium]|nr:two-component system response regulator [Methylotenera sp.]
MTNTQLFDDCSVLIVDDQSTSRTILSHVVKSINPKTKVFERTNPEEALEWATEHTADLVLV